MKIANTTQRVAESTPAEINEEIQRRTEVRIAAYAAAGPGAITYRLQELDEEWDIERVLEANGSSILLFGTLLGFFNRRWLVLPLAVGAFCLQHALQGWCPPIEMFRRLGVRTAREIEEERMALKALRGDFEGIPLNEDYERDIGEVLRAVRH